jgi:hypothetical protein
MPHTTCNGKRLQMAKHKPNGIEKDVRNRHDKQMLTAHKALRPSLHHSVRFGQELVESISSERGNQNQRGENDSLAARSESVRTGDAEAESLGVQ